MTAYIEYYQHVLKRAVGSLVWTLDCLLHSAGCVSRGNSKVNRQGMFFITMATLVALATKLA